MSGLPTGYTELEYIQSTGEQYIDTGFVPNQDTRVYAECVLPISAGSTQALFGSRVSSSSRQYQFVTQGGYYRSDYNTTINNFTKHDYGAAKFYVDKNKNITDLNKEYSATQTYGSFTCPGNMYIFATNNNGGLYGYAKAKLYKLTIYDNGKLARDFIPCKTASGVIGLYDTVGRQFYANAGTGTFTAGPEIIPDPPAAPTGLHTVLAVVLQWAASANADRYDVYRDGAKLGSTEGTQCVDTTSEANQTYVYTVKAVNGGGESAGTSITVYTKSGYFEYKPLIESANFP